MKRPNQSNLEHNKRTVCWCNQSQLRHSIIGVPKNTLTSKVPCNWSLENLIRVCVKPTGPAPYNKYINNTNTRQKDFCFRIKVRVSDALRLGRVNLSRSVNLGSIEFLWPRASMGINMAYDKTKTNMASLILSVSTRWDAPKGPRRFGCRRFWACMSYWTADCTNFVYDGNHRKYEVGLLQLRVTWTTVPPLNLIYSTSWMPEMERPGTNK